MDWTPEAQDAIKRAPPFVRGMARKAVEAFAKNRGMALVTLEVVNEVRDKMMGRSSAVQEAEDSDALNRGTNRRETMHLTADRRFLAKETGDPLHEAFDRKLSVHAMPRNEPLRQEEVAPAWADAMRGECTRQRVRTIYVHVPFCQNHCLFCGFYQNANRRAKSDAYVDALLDEIALTSSEPYCQQRPFQAVYFGGGTPTALRAKDLHRLVREVRSAFPMTNDCEVTLEGRVFDFDPEKARAAVDGGVTRFSLGVQTFDTRIRQSIGRKEPRERVLELLAELRDLEKAVVVIDLIYGLPGQTLESWEEDIKTYLSLGIDGCDLYQLTLFEGGPLDSAVKRGRLPRPTALREQGDFFRRGVEVMEAAHQRRLSLTHWARTPRERSLYDTFSRGRSECVPLGAGAGGWLGNGFFFNEGELEPYAAAIAAGRKPIAMALRSDPFEALFRDISYQIEMGYCDLARLGDEHRIDVGVAVGPVVEQWQRAGLVRLEGGCLYLSPAGEFWAVNLAQILIDILQMRQPA